MSAGPNEFRIDRADGVRFDDSDVARCYGYRAPYAAELYDFVTRLCASRRRLLDLGCGTGKIALALSDAFTVVDGVDPSAPMLAVARVRSGPRNIRWIQSGAEDAPLCPPYDLVTAGASLHWMIHEVVFPRIAEVLAPGAVLAVVSGDDAHKCEWRGELDAFLTRWLARVGRTYDPVRYAAANRGYISWLDVHGERSFAFEHRTPLRHYIEAQHSRSMWTRAVMGATLAQEFDDDLAATLAPFAKDGFISFQVESNLVWGRPRTSPLSEQNA